MPMRVVIEKLLNTYYFFDEIELEKLAQLAHLKPGHRDRICRPCHSVTSQLENVFGQLQPTACAYVVVGVTNG